MRSGESIWKSGGARCSVSSARTGPARRRRSAACSTCSDRRAAGSRSSGSTPAVTGSPSVGEWPTYGESFRHTSGYLGMTYTDQLLIVEITFPEGRDDGVKKSLLAEINRNLVAAGVVGEDDVFVLISEIGRANVSFGKGLAQRAPTAQLAG